MKKQILLTSLLTLTFCNISFSQDIGFYATKAWTQNYEIENPYGIGGFLSKAVGKDLLKLQFDYTYLRNKREFTGRIISGFMPPEDFSEIERIESKSSNNSYGLALLFRSFSWHDNSIYAGAGLRVSQFRGKRTGLNTGLKKELWETTKFGTVLLLQFQKKDFLAENINLVATYRYHFLNGGNIATDTENTFVGEMSLLEFQLGLSIHFR